MKKALIILVAGAAIALGGCAPMTTQERQLTGGLVGATAGLLTASALNASAGWTLVTALAGATAGTLVARNYGTGMCAYARRDGRFDTRRCR
ncbi:MAG: glucose-6-phosphate isomerase [Paracoccaceae bacterium]|nr:glucose-6-phosphate isomerase [Maritimibacter sp.]